MRESRTYGFVRGAHSDMRPYRDPLSPLLSRLARVACNPYKDLVRRAELWFT
jgi:hypothetical protein